MKFLCRDFYGIPAFLIGNLLPSERYVSPFAHYNLNYEVSVSVSVSAKTVFIPCSDLN